MTLITRPQCLCDEMLNTLTDMPPDNAPPDDVNSTKCTGSDILTEHSQFNSFIVSFFITKVLGSVSWLLH